MRIYWQDGKITSSILDTKTAAGLGFFDGMHLGHQAIAAQVVELGASLRVTSVLVTFDRHPLSIVKPQAVPPLLTTPAERRRYMWELGIQAVAELVFDERLARLSPEEFIREVLVGKLNVAAVAAGEDFTFGHEGRGTTAFLRQEGRRWGIESVVTVPPVLVGGEKVSSTRIRGLLQAGDVEAAARLLGHPYRLAGPVIRGEGRGRRLGFPTANIGIEETRLVPRDGVYAVTVREMPVEDGEKPTGQQESVGVLSISSKPTFRGEGQTVEVHLLDHEGDYYGKHLEISFHRFLRPIRKFASSDELRKQIAVDVAAVRSLFAKGPPSSGSSFPAEKIYSL
ncbi:MAG TPA: bifunctional riboflavin kinase/FAD synthetase [Firmicutes bacterium]|nr:bifunctional riboflavin kinase/FAD synthetase [Bacillota bacterium]